MVREGKRVKRNIQMVIRPMRKVKSDCFGREEDDTVLTPSHVFR